MATGKAALNSICSTLIWRCVSLPINGQNILFNGQVNSCKNVDFLTRMSISQQARIYPMSALPVYEVEFIPLERRLGDRRIAPRNAALPPVIKADRRKITGRRGEDRTFPTLKIV
jgi:hypothetical protein